MSKMVYSLDWQWIVLFIKARPGLSTGPTAYGLSSYLGFLTTWQLGSQLELLKSILQENQFEDFYETLLLLPSHFLSHISHKHTPDSRGGECMSFYLLVLSSSMCLIQGRKETDGDHLGNLTIALHFSLCFLLCPLPSLLFLNHQEQSLPV